MSDPILASGFTTKDIARRFRVSPDKVRRWIVNGALRAVNTATVLCGKPRYIVTVDALADFERIRAAATPPKPTRRRRKQPLIDFYPD